VKRSFRKYFRIIFLEEKIGFKINYLKRQGQTSGATGPAHWEKWFMALGRCGKRRRDEEKKYTSYGEFGPKEFSEYRKRFLMPRI
jgi:hypothetical protein